MKRNRLPVFNEPAGIRSTSKVNRFLAQFGDTLDYFFQTVLSVAAGWAFVHLITMSLSLEVNELILMAALLFLSVTFLLMRRLKVNFVGYIIFAAVIGGVIIFTIDEIIAEAEGIIIRMMECFNEYYDYQGLPAFTVEPEYDVTLIMSVISFFAVWVTAYSYGERVSPTVLAVFFFLPLIGAVLLGVHPPVIVIALAACVLVTLFFTCRTECNIADHSMPEEMRYSIRFPLMLVAMLLSIALMFCSNSVIYPKIESWFQRVSENYDYDFLRRELSKIPGNPLNASDDGLTHGDLSRAGVIRYNHEPELLVSVSENNYTGPLYLRDFAADLYTGDHWVESVSDLEEKTMPVSIYYSNILAGEFSSTESFYRNPFIYYDALQATSLLHTSIEYNTVHVRKLYVSSRTFYMPYHLRGAISGTTDMFFERDLMTKGSESAGTSFPVFQYQTLHRVIEKLKAQGNATGEKNPDDTQVYLYVDETELLDLAANTYHVELSEETVRNNPHSTFVLKNNGLIGYYRLKDSAAENYEEYVLSTAVHSSDLPEIQAAAEEILRRTGVSRDELLDGFYPIETAEMLINATRSYLKENFTYNERPGTIHDGDDFLTVFYLRKSGYHVHFATAGAVILQELGIPARYVEGFRLTGLQKLHDAEAADDDTYAWCEVFLQGFGWQPVDMLNNDFDEPENPFDKAEEPSIAPSADPNESMSEAPTEDPTEMTTEEAPLEPATAPSMEDVETRAPEEIPEDPENHFGLWLIILLAVLLTFGIVFFLVLLRRIRPLSYFETTHGRRPVKRTKNKEFLAIYQALRFQAVLLGRYYIIDDSPETVASFFLPEDRKNVQKMQCAAKAAYYGTDPVDSAEIDNVYALYAGRRIEASVMKEGIFKKD